MKWRKLEDHEIVTERDFWVDFNYNHRNDREPTWKNCMLSVALKHQLGLRADNFLSMSLPGYRLWRLESNSRISRIKPLNSIKKLLHQETPIWRKLDADEIMEDGNFLMTPLGYRYPAGIICTTSDLSYCSLRMINPANIGKTIAETSLCRGLCQIWRPDLTMVSAGTNDQLNSIRKPRLTNNK